MQRFHLHLSTLFLMSVATLSVAALSRTVAAAEPVVVSYEKDVAPVLRKYCAGCHNDADRDGEFSLESYASLMQGLEDGPALLPGDPDTSRIVRLLTGMDEPQMPPEDEPQPSAEEIETLKLWVEQGAKGPDGGEPDRLSMLRVPKIETNTQKRPVTAIAVSPGGDALAVARYAEVEVSRELRTKDAETGKTKRDWFTTATLKDFPGKVNSAHFCLGGGKLVTSSGVAGLGGVATLWEWPLGRKIREFKGHRDIMFDAKVSPDGKLLATCSYDHSILIWDLQTGEKLRQLSGHNGAVYDVAFSPDSRTLVSASADATCKVWRVRDGERLDTLGQPLKEQYSVSFSPDGRFIAAGGADNRIRVWRFVSQERPRINPILFARFAHEGPIVKIAYSADGKQLVSISEDRTIKVWETRTLTETQLIEDQPAVGMALAIDPTGRRFAVGRLDGSTEFLAIQPTRAKRSDTPAHEVQIVPKTVAVAEMNDVQEQEPNHTPESAQAVTLPAVIKGTVNTAGDDVDADCFRFSAKAGEEWVFEVNAARSKSGLDSFLEIVTPEGAPIERVKLQAVRDSYFTFRGKTADQTNDFRLFNWTEMELDEYLYTNGEVVKLWLYPRGPDSGFDVYPGSGMRWGYFDTTPLAHALGEPCYIVEPYAPDAELIPNGLPVFPAYFQNDDESQRKLGKDSKLIFTAPADGEYVVRLRDVRNFDGENFHYTLTVRPRQQDFSVDLATKKISVPVGGAQEIRVSVDRKDQFDGPVEVNLSGFPAGYRVTSPILVQAGQISAAGVVMADAQAQPLDAEALQGIRIEAVASISGKRMIHAVAGFQELKLTENPKLLVEIVPATGGVQPVGTLPDGTLEFEIEQGQTIMLQVNADRKDHGGEISFGKEDAGRNLPHGVIVDNIGLNGLLMLEGQSEREFFLTAAKWVPEQSRLIHLRTGSAGGVATRPILLHVRSVSRGAATGAE